MTRRPRAPIAPAALCLSLGLALGAAAATWSEHALAQSADEPTNCQPDDQLSSCIDADNLWIRPGAGPFLSAPSTTTAPEGQASFGFVLSYLSQPIGVNVASADEDGTDVNVLDNMLDATFLFSLGATDTLELTFAAPTTLLQDGAGLGELRGTDEEIPRSVIRDVRFGYAWALLPVPRTGSADGFSLLHRFELGLPVGDERNFGGGDSGTFVPSVSAAYRTGPLLATAHVGGRIRRSVDFANATWGSQVEVGLGVGAHLLPDNWLFVGGEAFGLGTLSSQSEAAGSSGGALIPAEWILSATTAPVLGGDIAFTLGGGGPIPLSEDPALTNPRFRFNAAVRYAPSGRDQDADGVRDRDDACISVAEDRDGFEDEDGCPDPDNDEDGIPDISDRCRDEPETVDGTDDEDGCPDVDDDGDGVPDEQDQCRNDPEDQDGYQDDDGCPDPDNDGDGILDGEDRCPTGAEDVDGYRDTDGCPDPDNDLDQIPDEADQCPTETEDRDGFQDEDGCPDPDNDRDGVLDANDKCPTEAETLDGTDDDDGCPEPGAQSRVRFEGDRVVVEGLSRFAPGRSDLTPQLREDVQLIGRLVRSRMPLNVVIVEAYADRAGTTPAIIDLAAKRASAVKAVLVEQGIAADKITAAAGDTAQPRPPGAPQIAVTAMGQPQ